MKFTAVAFAALAAVASAADCNLIKLAGVAGGANAKTCGEQSTYSVISATYPTDDQFKVMCFSTECQALLDELKAAAPTECEITLVSPAVSLYEKLLNPIQAECDKRRAAASTPAPTTSSPVVTPTPAPSTPVSSKPSC